MKKGLRICSEGPFYIHPLFQSVLFFYREKIFLFRCLLKEIYQKTALNVTGYPSSSHDKERGVMRR